MLVSILSSSTGSPLLLLLPWSLDRGGGGGEEKGEAEEVAEGTQEEEGGRRRREKGSKGEDKGNGEREGVGRGKEGERTAYNQDSMPQLHVYTEDYMYRYTLQATCTGEYE